MKLKNSGTRRSKLKTSVSKVVDAKLKAALMLHKQGQLEQAEVIINDILRYQPQYIDALQLLAVIASQRNNLLEAVEIFGRVLKINPDHAGVLNNRGVILAKMNLAEQALESSEQALAINPNFLDALNNRGKFLCQLGRAEQALGSYEQALAINPHFVDAFNNRGNALLKLNLFDQALDSFERAIVIKPSFVEAHNNKGNTLMKLRRYKLALASYKVALEIRPNFPEVLYNYGNTLGRLNRLKEALESYAQALKETPDYVFLYGLWLHTKMMICDWSDVENQILLLTEKIEQDKPLAQPFQLLGITSSGAIQRKAAELYVQVECPASDVLSEIPKLPKHDKIRIGYFSADFHNHATAYLMAELVELHDKSRFELIAFSFGPESNDEMRQRMAGKFDRFIEVSHLSDKEVALQSRGLGIDIAIDLKGHTMDSRPGIFALRAAPVQVSYLGYPGTMGAEYIDYLIADSTLIPETHQQYYVEKIAYLPNSYQVNDSKRVIAEKMFTRAELGLPETGFVFCCFNKSYKVTPSVFDSWMKILKRIEGSVLWLFKNNEEAVSNLRKEAEIRGVDPDRLVFASEMDLPEHLARHRLADLFLDTFPCNAHTTASDALWAGLPVLTCLGESFASRVAASLLNAIDLPELITSSIEDYEALAIELALDTERLKGIKKQLADNRLTTALFNTALFTRHIEAAYMEIYRRYQADLVPEHFYVDVGLLR